MVFICGCSSEGYPMTEEESDAIAQYCAYLLMKYDQNGNVNEKLMDFKDMEKIKDEEHKAKLKEQQIEAAKKQASAITAEPKPEKDSPDNTKEDDSQQQKDDQKTDNKDKKDDKKSEKKDDKSSERKWEPETGSQTFAASLDELYSGSLSDSFVIKYDSSGTCKKYDESDFFTIPAPSKKKILFVNFNIKNSSEKNIRFTATDYDVSFTLYDNKNEALAPELAALNNELLYMDETILNNSDYTATLLFFVDESASEYVLRARNNSNGKIYDNKIK